MTAATPTASTDPPLDRRMRILLVDDRAENLLALESILGGLGQILVRASSGREALRRVLEDEYAVILLDVQMPEMNGFETAQLIRSRERSQHTPILFLTAIDKSQNHVSRGYSVGAIDYIFKPFDADVLRAKVSAFVELARANEALREEIHRRKEAEETVRRLNADLERRVTERTAELERTNNRLAKEITERLRAEASVRTLNDRLQRAMTETHHRVKNNLQIIAAMLDMQLMSEGASVTFEEIRRLGSHVRTLAAVHDILTQQAKADGEAHWVSARAMLDQLLPMLQETAGGHRIRFELSEGLVTARQATSLALVVNELVSNALKHGRSSVDVSLDLVPSPARLEVCDDGPGFPPGFDPVVASNTGLDLVRTLAEWDLTGEVQFENRPEGGACARIMFPLAAAAE